MERRKSRGYREWEVSEGDEEAGLIAGQGEPGRFTSEAARAQVSARITTFISAARQDPAR